MLKDEDLSRLSAYTHCAWVCQQALLPPVAAIFGAVELGGQDVALLRPVTNEHFPRPIGVKNADFSLMSEQARVLGKRVLLVDDDPGPRESIKLLLTIDRHTVIEAKNGHEALELFHQGVFDLVIIDYFMPQMQGRELASNIRLTSASVPILMVTAYLEKLVDIDNQFDAIVAKPFAIAELRQAIAKLLRP